MSVWIYFCNSLCKILNHYCSAILNFLMTANKDQQPEFVMEVTDKTRADVKVLEKVKNELTS